jgi:hypothetical protein
MLHCSVGGLGGVQTNEAGRGLRTHDDHEPDRGPAVPCLPRHQ